MFFITWNFKNIFQGYKDAMVFKILEKLLNIDFFVSLKMTNDHKYRKNYVSILNIFINLAWELTK